MNMLAQSTQVAGIYSLSGMREMAGGFEFNQDNSFRFYYSYGAVDRFAEGTYSFVDKKIFLKSNKEAGRDFIITKQSALSKGFTIKVTDKNQYLAETVRCVVLNDSRQEVFFADKAGVIKIDLPKASKIYLQHQLFPDILSLVKDESNPNDYFEVELSPLLQQVSFKGIDLTLDGDTLKMPTNYFMPFENIRFVKNQE